MIYPYATDTYAGWNFTSIWKADMAPPQNGGYPLLFAQGKVEITIINISGQTVFRRSVESVHSAVPVNIEGLPGGLYIIYAGNAKGHYSRKFVKK